MTGHGFVREKCICSAGEAQTPAGSLAGPLDVAGHVDRVRRDAG